MSRWTFLTWHIQARLHTHMQSVSYYLGVGCFPVYYGKQASPHITALFLLHLRVCHPLTAEESPVWFESHCTLNHTGQSH